VSGSWSAADSLKARENACKGTFRPVTYKVRVDDSHAHWRLELAARALWGQSVPGFLLWCAEYVLRHHRGLKEVRRAIRFKEREMRKAKRRRAREEKREKRATPNRGRRPA
jgi:hypothetical protein